MTLTNFGELPWGRAYSQIQTLGRQMARRYAPGRLRSGNSFRRNVRQRTSSSTSRTRTGTTTRRRQVTPNMNTFQNDAAPRYAYRPMPARRRRRWVGAVRRNLHMDMAQQPLQVCVTQSVRERSSVANGGAAWSKMCGGMSYSAVANDTNDEILNCFQDAYNLTGATVDDIVAACLPYKLQMKSICLDVQIKNLTEASACVMDIYLVKCRKRHNEREAVHTHYEGALTDMSPVARTGATELSLGNPAVTPFDAPDFCSIWKILRKTEVIISPGQTVTKQIRAPGNRFIDGRRLTDCPQAMPGTLALLFTWHGSPTADTGSGDPGISPIDLVFTTQTVCHYAVPPGSLTKEAGAAHV